MAYVEFDGQLDGAESASTAKSFVPFDGELDKTSGIDPKLAPEQFKSGVAGMQSGFFANNAKNNAAALNAMDRVDAGERLSMEQDPLGYQDMNAQQRAKVRAQFAESMTGNVAKAIKYNAEQKTYGRNPSADQVIDLANKGDYSGAWNAFKKDPAGVLQQLSVESAPNAIPSLAGGAFSVAVRGGTAGLMAGLATGSFPVEYLASISESLQQSGVDLNDTKAVEAKLRDPVFIDQAGKRAATRGTVIAAADGATGKLLAPLRPGQILKNVGRAGANIGTETGMEMAGEAGAQLASGEELQVGNILAEGLGAGPQAVAQTGLKTISESRKPQVSDITSANSIDDAIQAAESFINPPAQPAPVSSEISAAPAPIAQAPELVDQAISSAATMVDAPIPGSDTQEGAAPDLSPSQQDIVELEREVGMQSPAQAMAARIGAIENPTPAQLEFLQKQKVQPAANDPVAATKEWESFSPESGTLGIPRADMPQIKAEHRGAMTNFLNARGVSHETVEIPASELKPTQQEFSPAKVRQAQEYTDGDRSILVSSDNHIVDGHHQWLAKLNANEPVKAIKLNAPIEQLLSVTKEFPSASVAEGATPTGDRRKDFATRKLVDQMSQDEMRKALLTSELTGISNKRAFEERRQSNPKESVLYGDLDDFKSLNTKYGHEGADQILRAVGNIKAKVAESLGVTPYHRSGDEFLATGDNDAKLETYGKKLQEELENAVVEVTMPDGSVVEHKRIGFSYGTGKNEQLAESKSDEQKAERKRLGLRVGQREAVPAPEQGRENNQGDVERRDRNPIRKTTPLAHDGLKDDSVRAELQRMADEAGWDQVGGRMIREVADDPGSRVTGRTPWIPKAEWYGVMSERLNERDTQAAVKKALNGSPMTAKEKRVVGQMLDLAQARNKEIDDYYAQKETESDSSDYLDAVEALSSASDQDLDVLIEGGSTDQAEMMRALGFTEQEIEDELGQKEKTEDRQSAGETTARTTAKSDQRSGNETRPVAEERQPRALTLESAQRLAKQFNAQGTETSVEPHPTVKGKYILKSTAESNGKTNTPAFKKWFGDSKVVDENGDPLVVYHGTNANQDGDAFTFFDTYASNYGLMGMGGYFTEDPSVASQYTKKGRGDSPSVYPVYLSIKNPLDMEAVADSDAWKAQFEGIEEYHEAGDTNESWYRAAEEMLTDQELPKYEGAEIMQEGLRSMGHDGITHIGGGRIKDDSVRHRVWIAFEPEQIKSATGNVGTFDPTNPDIRKSQTSPRRGMAVDDVRRATNTLRAKLLGFQKINIVQSEADLPAEFRDAVGTGTEGFYDPASNTVHLIASNIATPERAVWVTAHETIGHAGLRGLRDQSVTEAVNLAGKNRFIGDLAKAISGDRGTDAHAVEEAVAELAAAIETDNFAALERRYGVTVPASSMNGVRGVVARVIEKLKQFLAKMTGKERPFSDAEVRNLIAQARDAVSDVSAGRNAEPARLSREMLASEKAPVFYSALARAIPQMSKIADKNGMVGAEQARLWLTARQKEGKFKAEELQWSGLDDWLKLQGGKVSLADIENFVRDNGVKVEEVMKAQQWSIYNTAGDIEYFETKKAAQDRINEELEWAENDSAFVNDNRDNEDRPSITAYDYDNNIIFEAYPNEDGEWVREDNGRDDIFDDADDALEAAQEAAESTREYWKGQVSKEPEETEGGSSTKYGQYILLGAENYRELLLTLPKKNKPISGRRAELASLPGSEMTPELRREYEALLREDDSKEDTPYRSSHWDETNIIAHIRFNDRTDADGKSVLFIEELQSDWGQEGKKRGFSSGERGKLPDGYSVKQIDPKNYPNAWVIADENGNPVSARFWGNDRADAERVAIENQEKDKMLVPTAPFVTDTKSWLSLGIKRMIRYASENGYDKIAFINGEQSADRYDLSKQVDAISYEKNADGTYDLTVWRNGSSLRNDGNTMSGLSESKLEESVGKEVAKKIINGDGESMADLGYEDHSDPNNPKPSTAKKLSGIDLKVGGEGMRAFYDRIVPQTVNDVLKKLGGGRVKEVYLSDSSFNTKQGTEDDALLDELGVNVEGKRPAYQIGFDITPEMRDKALAGQPLFSKKQDQTNTPPLRNVTPEQSEAYADAVKNGRKREALRILSDAVGVKEVSASFDRDGAHSPAGPEYGSPLYDISRDGMYPEDVYSSNGLRYYGTGEEKMDAEAYALIKKYEAHPNMRVTIYRAVDKDGGSKIRPGDWVTPIRSYAKEHGDAHIPDGYKIISARVYARDIFTSGDSWLEWGYHPQEFKPEVPKGDNKNIPLSQRVDSLLSNPDIRFSKAPDTQWIADAPSKLDTFLYTMQDKQIDTKRTVQAIRKASGDIDDKWNAYLQEELFHGRTAKGTKDFLDFELKPLLQEMQARGVEIDGFEDYLHARHAKERNAQIAAVNPEMPDSGSGISNKEADDYMAALSPEKRKAYDALAKRVDAINASTQKLLVSSGLEKQSTIDAWNAAYQHYVPLQREEVAQSGLGIGQGFSVRGGASKRAMGSKKGVIDILANVAMQRERALVRSEKNRVATALYGLAITAPNKDFWLPVNPSADVFDQVKKLSEKRKLAVERRDKAQSPYRRIQAENTISTIDKKIGALMAQRKRAIDDLVGLGIDRQDAESMLSEPKQRYIDERTGLVAERVNPLLRSAPNVLAVRVGGEDRFVFFNEKSERALRMASALKNLDADQLGRVLGVAAKASRWFAAVNTQYNPVFGVVNLLRDFQGALFNLSTTPIAGEQKKVSKYTPSALIGIYSDIRAHRKGKTPSSEWAQLWEEFQKEGGQTGFRDMFANSADRTEALQKELERMAQGKARAAGRAVFNWLSDYNETLENAVRLSAYKVAKEKGLSKEQSASIAKNLTVNFNRKGQVALQAGALYAFFNASVQGTARLHQTLFKEGTLIPSKTGAKIIAGGLILGVMQALMLSAAGFGDDEPPEFVKERSLVIPTGGGKYISIPMPLGLHIIPSLSRIPTEWMMSGFKKTPQRIADIVGLFAETFNPIGNSGLSIQTIAPTVADPFVALAENRDFTGKPIAKKDFSSLQPTPGYTRTKDTASEFSKVLSYYLNFAGGGTKYQPGIFSPTPDQLDYLIGQVTGGVGREAMKLEQSITSRFTGEELPAHKIPLAGRFYGDTKGQSAEASNFYENLKMLNGHELEIKGRRKAGEPVTEYMRENKESMLVQAGNAAERKVSELNKRKRELVEKNASKEQVKLVEMQITSAMKSLNDRVEKMTQ